MIDDPAKTGATRATITQTYAAPMETVQSQSLWRAAECRGARPAQRQHGSALGAGTGGGVEEANLTIIETSFTERRQTSSL
eukprot:CAMPEP_0181174342 /NCGR_PEP_ID=MMETSP1096-20121128/3483_1 /TAXON_ID=156174 ORGANISM="Chrysochromulina ericina, Strain CCMP281" /NCGR_SAMPLE_ID=MMETSP1096 /ASSEMBLY_ACC=CAM_ASM_000453 /LENGTH=80 /DNA_ID=CAMNT_0023262233 /DNA_START=410 /DNA_END=652 /DNA_ORIENTATION=+